MSDSRPTGERTVPAPVVLAIASMMVAIGGVAYVVKRQPAPSAVSRDAGTTRPRATLADETELEAAETFLDAWRKRDHEVALAVSIATAHNEALARKKAEDRVPAADRAATDRIWNEMSRDRLHFVIENRRPIDASRAYVEGHAEGQFLGRPYARRVGFEVVRDSGRYRVSRMDLGPELEPSGADAGRGDASP